MFLSVIIPAYNESKRISDTLFSVSKNLSRQNYDYEILVVNDGSKDNTAQVVKGLAGKISHLRLIDNEENHGKGWVVKQGMLEARGVYRLFMDADNSTTVDQVAGFFHYFKEGNDIVIGSRRIKGAKIAVHQPLFRDFLGGVFRFIVHIIVPLGVTDSQAGFKMFSSEAANKVFTKQTVFRWAFDVEILAIARKMKLRIAETPIVWVNDAESHVKLGGMIRMFFEVLNVRWNLILGKYNDKKQKI